MNYLIVLTNAEPFYTNWFTAEDNFIEGMTVFNLLRHTYTINGKDWHEIQQDHL